MLRLLALLSFTLLPACVSTPTADVYLLAGQSNMQGVGRVVDLPAEAQRPVADTWFWTDGGFEPLDPLHTRLSTRAGEFGPEIGFAHGLRAARPDGPVYLVKFHRSGQGLAAGWDGGRWCGVEPGPERANFHPGDGPDDPCIGRHYRAWIEQVRRALDQLRAAGVTPVVRGVVWMQGEQDSKQVDAARTYAANLRRLRARLGDDLGVPGLPWVFGQVLPHEPALPRFAHRDEIRAGMAALDARSGSAAATPGFRMVSTDGMSLRDDAVHYDAAGLWQLGLAFAGATVELGGAAPAAAPGDRQVPAGDAARR